MKDIEVNPKVSLIVPVYNVETYLPACLESCISQTLYDIEIICINDGSTDESLHILTVFAEKDTRIKVITKANGGLSSARNAGLKEATGDIIMFLDSDDYLATNACERVYVEFQEAPTEIVVFGTSTFPSFPAPESWYNWILSVQSKRYSVFSEDVLFKQNGAIPFVWRQAFSHAFLKENNLSFYERIKYGEDVVFQLEAFPHSKNISFISDPLYWYRWYREDSLMGGAKKDRSYKATQLTACLQEISTYWKKQDWFSLYGASFLKWMLKYIVPELAVLESKQKKELETQVVKMIEENNLLDYRDVSDKEEAFFLGKLYKRIPKLK